MATPSPRSSSPTPGAPAHGSDLLGFPRPTLAVDVALLTVVPADASGPGDATGGLAVLLLERSGDAEPSSWALPGAMVRERERLEDAVLRTLRDKCGIEGLAPRHLGVFDDPDRDPRGWVISLAHSDAVPFERLGPVLDARPDLTLAPVRGSDGSPAADPPGRQRRLPFDHDLIVGLAVADIRDRYRNAPDPAGLLGEPFTLLELRQLHERVLGEPLQKDTFRRQVIDGLEELNKLSEGTVGRPARLFRHRR